MLIKEVRVEQKEKNLHDLHITGFNAVDSLK